MGGIKQPKTMKEINSCGELGSILGQWGGGEERYSRIMSWGKLVFVSVMYSPKAHKT